MQPILRINLSTKQVSTFRIPVEWERSFIGGTALAARILYQSLTIDLDPLSENAPLLILTGPLTGTYAPATSRFVVCGKSPATGYWAESNCGGFWGVELRCCGYDGLFITGHADITTYLWLNNDHLVFRDAGAIWGKDTAESQAIICGEIGVYGTRVLTIGPAGENGVVFAGMFCDHQRAAGRTGLGAVAGSKNLKAIAVKGTKKIPIAETDRFTSIRREANRIIKYDNIAKILHTIGTAGVVDYADYIGSMPKKYFHQSMMDGIDKITGSTMAETILQGVSACHACIIACGRVVGLGDGVKRKGPEYETVVGFGPNLLNNNLSEIVKLSELCDLYGMDTISASNTIGLAFHLYEQGVISEKETGYPLHWGDTTACKYLLRRIVQKEGIGRWMASGSRAFAAHYGIEEEAVQVNGLEIAYHDPRAVSGMALVYATSPRGGCHNKSDYFFVDWGQADVSSGLNLYDKQAGAEKSANVAHHQNWRSVFDAVGMCYFSNISPELLISLINSACGYNLNFDELIQIGERSWNIRRAINTRLGLTQLNDTLPPTLLKPYSDGPVAGYVPPLKEMLDSYYKARNWDPKNGRPKKEKLLELGLEDVADDLYQ